MTEEVYKKRWEYIKSDPDGARALLLLLKHEKGTPNDFDTMIDRIIESRRCSDDQSARQNIFAG